MQRSIALRAGHLTLEVSPPLGGSIASFTWTDGGRQSPILRGCGSGGDILAMASFPLVPFANRVRPGGFSFRGARIPLAPNMPREPNPIHGQGWQRSWDFRQSNDRRVELCFVHDAGEWPWSYEARQIIALDDAGVSLQLSCRNLSQNPMPCGLGQHPHFPCGPETRLHAQVAGAWSTDRMHFPVEKIPPSGRYSLSERLICSQDLNQCFCGWSGSASISDSAWPFSLRMSSPDAMFLQVYSPAPGGFFAAEPISHSVAALNECEDDWPELGLKVLQPGDEARLRVRIDVIERT